LPQNLCLNADTGRGNSMLVMKSGGNAGDTAHAVATREPNAWGLYDMLGNLAEWTHDWNEGGGAGTGAVTDPWGQATGTPSTFRTVRGGSIFDTAMWVRAALRGWTSPGGGGDNSGFRPVRTLP
jgi:formylglycine-generating enzyme required for sulfatase activity